MAGIDSDSGHTGPVFEQMGYITAIYIYILCFSWGSHVQKIGGKVFNWTELQAFPDMGPHGQ